MLKKTILISALLSSMLMAKDTYFEFGAGMLTQKMTGDITVKPGNEISEYSLYDNEGADTTNIYTYIDIQAIPILPNIKIDYIAPRFQSNNLNASYTLSGKTTSEQTTGSYDLDTTQIGGYLYYDLLSFIDFASLDFGVGAKYVDYDLIVKDTVTGLTIYETSDSAIIPVVYIHPDLRYGNFILEGEGKGISYEGDTYYEFKVGGKYLFDLPAGKIGLEAGYFYSKLETAEDSDLFNNTYINVKTDGFYAGINYSF